MLEGSPVNFQGYCHHANRLALEATSCRSTWKICTLRISNRIRSEGKQRGLGNQDTRVLPQLLAAKDFTLLQHQENDRRWNYCALVGARYQCSTSVQEPDQIGHPSSFGWKNLRRSSLLHLSASILPGTCFEDCCLYVARRGAFRGCQAIGGSGLTMLRDSLRLPVICVYFRELSGLPLILDAFDGYL